jgi:tetratricopeptide (TPR) repeat protein
VTIQPEPGAVRQLCAAADEALIEGGFCTGEFDTAERLFTEAREVAARAGDREGQASAVGGLGQTLHYRNISLLVAGDVVPEAAGAAEEELMRRALALWQQTGDSAGTARGLFGVSLVFQVLRRDWDAAMPYLWQAFGLSEAAEESGDLYGRSEICRHVGFYYLVRDVRPREAVRQLGHSLALRERLGDPRRMPSALVALGEAEVAAGRPERAVELFRRAVTLAREQSLLPWRIHDAEENLATGEAALAADG